MKPTITHKPSLNVTFSRDCSAMRFGYEWNIMDMEGYLD